MLVSLSHLGYNAPVSQSSDARANSRALARLQRVVVACRRCPRLVRYREQIAREKVRRYRDVVYWGRPLPSFGDPAARLFVVGLAPAAHGGNRTGRMFTGDDSGHWLTRALHANGFANQPTSSHRGDGLKLRDAYITAALRCAPPGNKPSVRELSNCRPYFLSELRLLSNVTVVVALGRIAFDSYLRAREALGRVPVKPRLQFAHNRVWRLPDGVTLIASYHPSRQNTQTGRLTRRMFAAVFRSARRALEGSRT